MFRSYIEAKVDANYEKKLDKFLNKFSDPKLKARFEQAILKNYTPEEIGEYLFKYNSIEQIQQNWSNIYGNNLLKDILHVKVEAIGEGEVLIVFLIENAKFSSKGAQGHDVIIGSQKYEVKWAMGKEVRLGVEGIVFISPYISEIRKTVAVYKLAFNRINKSKHFKQLALNPKGKKISSQQINTFEELFETISKTMESLAIQTNPVKDLQMFYELLIS